jgi:AraC family transcriptional regulator
LPVSVCRQIIDKIKGSIGASFSIAEFARLAHMGQSNFLIYFRNTFDMPLHRSVITRRMDRAALLLQGSNYSIQDIARKCGFSSQSHRTALFKKMHGSTPAQLRSQTCSIF